MPRPGEEEGCDSDDGEESRDLIVYFENATAAAAAASHGECDLFFFVSFFARSITSPASVS